MASSDIPWWKGEKGANIGYSAGVILLGLLLFYGLFTGWEIPRTAWFAPFVGIIYNYVGATLITAIGVAALWFTANQ